MILSLPPCLILMQHAHAHDMTRCTCGWIRSDRRHKDPRFTISQCLSETPSLFSFLPISQIRKGMYMYMEVECKRGCIRYSEQFRGVQCQCDCARPFVDIKRNVPSQYDRVYRLPILIRNSQFDVNKRQCTTTRDTLYISWGNSPLRYKKNEPQKEIPFVSKYGNISQLNEMRNL